MIRLRLAALALMVLAPICAEYVSGYDTSTGDLVDLLGGLVIFAPLYGAPALLIREAARRGRLGWVGIVLLAGAFGVLQAGLIDQSLFNDSYRDIDYWAAMREPTLIPGLGVSVNLVVGFVGGHVINSMAVPILIMEGIAGPRRRTTPWLGRPGLVVVSALFVAAAGLVLHDTLTTETFRISTAQLVGSVIAILALVVAAVTAGRATRRRASRPRGVPPWWAVGLGALVLALVQDQLPPSWLGTSGSLVLLAVAAGAVWVCSGRPGWSDRHRAALSAAVVAVAVAGFAVVPIRSAQSDLAILAHHVVMTLGTLALVLVAVRRSAPTGTRPVTRGRTDPQPAARTRSAHPDPDH